MGLAALAIGVQLQEPTNPLPTAHTCSATLRLPAYTTAEALSAGLATAFANTQAGGLHERPR